MPKCLLCKKDVNSLEHEIEHLIIEMIKENNAGWVEADGACPKCIEYYKGLEDLAEVE